jgi:2-polyprenyl-3-methyl-5-hydroxy-6-metoxy-1,4-benzoquinol methylase
MIMEKFTCSLCGGTQSRVCFQAYDFDRSIELFELEQCTGCGLALTKPAPEPSTMDRYYQGAYYGSGNKKFSGLIEFLTVLGCKLRAKKMLKNISNIKSVDHAVRVLDVGCGRANLLRSLRDSGCECHGTERSTFPTDSKLTGINIFKGSVTEGEYKAGFFDAVSIWHVLEHLHNPFVMLEEIARITHKGGIIAVAVPNFSSLQSNWFKSDWFHLDLPRHLYHFGVGDLCLALEQKGYSVDSVSTNSLEQNIFGFVQSFMNKFKFLGKPNEFYQLIKRRSELKQTLKLIFWLIIAVFILPLAMLEFVISCILKRGACAIVFAPKV